MSNKKRSYTKVTDNSHRHILATTKKNKCTNVGEGLSIIVQNSINFECLGLNDSKIKKLEMLKEILSDEGQNITLDGLMDRMINTAFNESVKIADLDQEKVINDTSIKTKGAARVRLIHFIEMIKEHNNNSEFTLKITQTLLSDGLTSGNKNRVIDMGKIRATDKGFFQKGTQCNRGAIKRIVMDNNSFTDYNNTLSDLSTRLHNQKSIKGLKKS